MVGLVPLFAVESLEPVMIVLLPAFSRRLKPRFRPSLQHRIPPI